MYWSQKQKGHLIWSMQRKNKSCTVSETNIYITTMNRQWDQSAQLVSFYFSPPPHTHTQVQTHSVISRPDKHRLPLNPLRLPLTLRCAAALCARSFSAHVNTQTDAESRLTCLRGLMERAGSCVTGTIHLAICFPVLYCQILPPPSRNQGRDEIQVPLWGSS